MSTMLGSLYKREMGLVPVQAMNVCIQIYAFYLVDTKYVAKVKEIYVLNNMLHHFEVHSLSLNVGFIFLHPSRNLEHTDSKSVLKNCRRTATEVSQICCSTSFGLDP
jgi:hypothetical protein